MNESVIIRNLVKRYRGREALRGFSVAIPALSSVGVVGRNGAGKTTLMSVLAGFVRPTSGEVNLLGLGPFDAQKHSGRVSILPQDAELPLEAKPRDLLVRYARLQGLSVEAARQAADSLLAAFNLSDRAKSPIKALSHGMRKRVMVAQAFIGKPDLVLLDEPLSGLDPVEADRMRAFIRARRGSETVLISSHQLDDIEKLCTHVAFVSEGKLERFEKLVSITSASGRVVYRLARLPNDVRALSESVPEAKLALHADRGEIAAEFAGELSPEAVNAKLIPALLEYGLVSVTVGRTLEEAYLGGARV